MGLTVLDAGVVIGLLDASDSHHSGARNAIAAAQSRSDRLVLPVSAYAETLVEPYRRGEGSGEIVDRFLDGLAIAIEPIDRAVASAAAELRAAHRSLRLPDALVIATAIAIHADRLLTTDTRWPETGVPHEIV